MENGNCALATRWRKGTTPGSSVIPDTQVSNIRTRESYRLVVWNMIFSHHIWNVIIPTDELHHWSEGFKPPTRQPWFSSLLTIVNPL